MTKSQISINFKNILEHNLISKKFLKLINFSGDPDVSDHFLMNILDNFSYNIYQIQGLYKYREFEGYVLI